MATTIYTYLHNDDVTGSRIISMDDCMCKLYYIIRDDSEFMKDFEENLKSPALYILINKKETKAYIGETDDSIKRILQHVNKKKFWSEVMVFLGSDLGTLGKTEVQYLEYLAIDKAKQAKSYDLSENKQVGKKPTIGVVQKGKTDKFFNYVLYFAKFAGCNIFEPESNTMNYSAGKPRLSSLKKLPDYFTNIKSNFTRKVMDSIGLGIDISEITDLKELERLKVAIRVEEKKRNSHGSYSCAISQYIKYLNAGLTFDDFEHDAMLVTNAKSHK